MSPTDSNKELQSGVRCSDHLSATTTRKGKIVGFGESQGRGRAASGDADTSGQVAIGIAGTSPRGEDGALGACQRLIGHINLDSECWGPPAEIRGVKHIDAVSPGVGSFAGKQLTIQVVRALTDPDFWQSLGYHGRVSISINVAEAADYLKSAILFKVAKIPPEVRATLTLALDASDVPGLSLHPVIDDFNQRHGEWSDAQGFEFIWVVGPWREMVSRLGAKA